MRRSASVQLASRIVGRQRELFPRARSVALEKKEIGMSNPVFANIPTMASYLISGYWGWAGYQGTAPRHWQSHTLTVNITGLNATEQGYATSALNAWHDVANVNFVYTSGAANI